jgi:hypothetical protein
MLYPCFHTSVRNAGIQNTNSFGSVVKVRVAIDDPLEQIRRIANDENSDLTGAAIQAAGLFAPVFKVVAIAKGVLDKQLNGSSLKAAVLALCDELQRLQSHWPSDFESALATSWFYRAIATLMDEAHRAANDDHARLLGGSLPMGAFLPDKTRIDRRIWQAISTI